MERRNLTALAVAFAVVGSLLAGFMFVPPAAGAPPQPNNFWGIARAADGSTPLGFGTRITVWSDGVDYSNGTSVFTTSGNYDVDVYGDWMVQVGVPNTPEVREGPGVTDPIMFAANEFTMAPTPVFTRADTWSPADVDNVNLQLGNADPPLLKIHSVTLRPVAPVTWQYVWLCNPTNAAIEGGEFWVQKNSPMVFDGPMEPVPAGLIGPGQMAYVNLSVSPLGFDPLGDNLKLVWDNPTGNGFNSGDMIVDRVEFNQTTSGSLYWEPGNTLMSNAAYTAVDGAVTRVYNSGVCINNLPPTYDTNSPIVDFAGAVPIPPPGANTLPTGSWVIPDGTEDWTGNQNHAITWNNNDVEDSSLTVVVDYSPTGAAPWTNVLSQSYPDPGPNSYNWLVPCDTTTTATLRLSLFDSGGGSFGPLLSSPFEIDCTRPDIQSTVPANGANNVDRVADFTVTFTEPMNTAVTGFATLTPPANPLTYTWTSSTVATIGHAQLAASTTYQLVFACTLLDDTTTGNQLAGCPKGIVFNTTGTGLIAPTVAISAPTGVEVWSGGSSHDVQFTITDGDDTSVWAWVNDTTTGGIPYRSVDPMTIRGTGTLQTVSVPVPSTTTSTYCIRVEVADDTGLTGFDEVCLTIDATPPTVVSTVPTNTADDVAVTTVIVITFSETMNTASVQVAFSSAPGLTGPTYSWNGPTNTILTINHGDMTECTLYTITIGTGARDVSDPGNGLAAAYVFSFTTSCDPQVTISSPPETGGLWCPGASASIDYLVIDEDTTVHVWVNSSTDGGVIYTTLDDNNRPTGSTVSLPFTVPSVNAPDARIRVTAGDSKGNTGYDENTYSIDGAPPTVTSTTPADGATGVSKTAAFAIVFSEAMDQTATADAITLSPAAGTLTFDWTSSSEVSITHADLADGTHYNLTIGAGAEDLCGNNIAPVYVEFDTPALPVLTADAGDPATITEGDSHTFDGSGSSSTPTGAIDNYTWVIRSGATVIATIYNVGPTYTFANDGTYVVTLTVRDDATGVTDDDTVTITVNPKQQPVDWTIWIILIIIIVVILLLIVLLLLKRRKKKEEMPEAVPTEEVETMPPAKEAEPLEEPEAAPPPRPAPRPAVKAPAPKPMVKGAPPKPAPKPTVAAPAKAPPKAGTKECPSCGTVVDAGDSECFMCGAKL